MTVNERPIAPGAGPAGVCPAGQPAAWRPSPAQLDQARLAGFVRRAGAATSRISRPEQPPTQPGSGPPPRTTSGSPGSAARRRSSTSPAVPPGPPGGAGDRSTTRSPRPSRGRGWPDAAGAGLGGRGRRRPALTAGPSSTGPLGWRPPSRGPGDRAGSRVGIFLPMLPETVSPSSRWAGSGRLQPDLQRLRRPGCRGPAGRSRRPT